MKRLVCSLAFAFAGVVLAQQVTKVFDLPNATANTAQLSRLPDGGVLLSSQCTVPFADGGSTTVYGSEDLAGAARTTALNVLDGRAKSACSVR